MKTPSRVGDGTYSFALNSNLTRVGYWKRGTDRNWTEIDQPEARDALIAARVELDAARDQIVELQKKPKPTTNSRPVGDARIDWLFVAKEALETLSGFVPDRNCSCHLSPPCGDCVNYGGAREVIEQLELAIEMEEVARDKSLKGHWS